MTDVLHDRMQPPSGLQWMVLASLGLHGVLATAMVLAPGSWMRRQPSAPRTTMTISLSGGGDGPRNGGMTAVGGRPVQVQRPPEEAPKREAIVQPAAKTPVMTLPRPNAKPTKAAPTTVKEAPDEARGRTPTKGAETSAGNSLAITGARGLGFGLASGGGPGSGSSLDVENFCCPDYIMLMIERIRSNWDQSTGATGEVKVQFTIRRDGSLVNPAIERSSGIPALDIAALRAVAMTKTIPPLPDAFPNPALGMHLNFQKFK
ncbi:MAG: TonB family protein [Acidobacteria bacterium]|nr:TonB family protein [Acidobacteriota bacterium]